MTRPRATMMSENTYFTAEIKSEINLITNLGFPGLMGGAAVAY